MPFTAVKLHNGMFRVGHRQVDTIDQAIRIAKRRGAEFLRIVEHGTGDLVDYLTIRHRKSA